MKRRVWHRFRFFIGGILVSVLLGFSSGCDTPVDETPIPELDYNYFTCEVQPVLARECSFPACHGNWQRPFRVLSPGRMRISEEYERARLDFAKADAKAGKYAPLTDYELDFNYEQCMGFVSDETSEITSQLLTRPLAPGGGGSFHSIQGENPYIGEICKDTRADACKALQLWLAGSTASEPCL